LDGRLVQYFQEHRSRHLAELDQFLRIPSVSTLPVHKPDIRRAAEWVADQLRTVGIEGVRIMETGGHPAVYGEWLKAEGAPTILVYGHYDVQPSDPADKWVTPPFEPAYRENRIYARGVSDDKGPSFIAMKAAEALLALYGRLPLNVKFLFEGEEEIGSPSLPPFVVAHRELLAADLVVSADGAMWRPSEPSITLSGRGMCSLEVDLTTARIDLHSGRHGGAVPNALHAMAELVSSLHDQDGRVAVAGFYDLVRELSADERANIAALPFDAEEYRQSLDLPDLVGEPGYSTLERQWTRPTIDVVGMWGGFQGEGRKTVIPCEAHAKITCRLVADQSPDEIAGLVAAHLKAHLPRGARIAIGRFPGGSLPYDMPDGLPVLAVAQAVLEDVMSMPAVRVRMGGTLPAAEIFQSTLGVYTLFFSFSTADEQYHAPNEFFRLERFDFGALAWASLWQRLGDQAWSHSV
jgi:acetylornithine deacetylase/succinyl-diaminopimelate desuccinylase-like protein